MTFSCLPENILEESISFLRFNTRADNVLKRNGVDTIGALLEVLILPEWIVFLIIGILGLISIPFWAEWKQKKNMELFKTAYEHSYDYIFEYPLSIILILALMFIGLGIYFISKKKKGRRFDEKND